MEANEIRKRFCDFFIKHQHQKIDSSPLVPLNDQTLLFANAGMNQFKDYFTGQATPQNKRAITVQKCVRAGGKHNDLENVGFTARHHTFFEMLGNFSFGDYFKEEAIDFAWKFLTEELKISKDKLYISVHESDEEAEQIWINQQNIPKERIFRRDDKENFWEMGDVGPCGPSSEIFYDHGAEYSDGQKNHQCLLDDEGRYVEIWNLVFMQYEKNSDGTIKNLPNPSIDTGAGLERIAALMQGKYWNYDSDLFSGIIKAIENLSGCSYQDPKYQSAMRVIADHARSCTMLITDGVIPSNDGRGYVLRRIIRRAVKFLSELGVKDIRFHYLVEPVLQSLGSEYPQNLQNKALAIQMLESEEKRFRETLTQGLKILDEFLDKKEKTLDGLTAFRLYDTYGFPVDLTQLILAKHKISVDIDGFNENMAQQRERAKKASKFQNQGNDLKVFYQIKEAFGATQFLGYQTLVHKAKVVAIEKLNDAYAIVTDKTPFYGESGGQIGDRGEIHHNGLILKIVDTQKPVEDLHVHFSEDIPHFKIADEVELIVGNTTRQLTMRNHSATHLLQAALIQELGEHITQAGSIVTDQKLRFDFTHPQALTAEQLQRVEDRVNQQISRALPVVSEVMDKEQAMAKGAMALFGEKYGDQVRVIQMGEFSTELCGGTHVANTHEIGLFVITLETSLASGVRRIEAMTSLAAFNFLKTRSLEMQKIERFFSTKHHLVFTKIEQLQDEIKNQQKEIVKLKDQLKSYQAENIFQDVQPINDQFSFVCAQIESEDTKELRKLSDLFVNKFPKSVGVLFTRDKNNDKVSFLIRTHAQNKNINCNSALKKHGSLIAARGGGKPDMVQGNGNSPKWDQFLKNIKLEFQQQCS